YHRPQNGHLRTTRHARVVAQAANHRDAGWEETGELLHEPRLESGGEYDEHRPRREQAPEGDEDDFHWATVIGGPPHVKLTHHSRATNRASSRPESLRNGSFREGRRNGAYTRPSRTRASRSKTSADASEPSTS